MTEQQKKDIQRLRKYKRTYAEISEITGVSINTMKRTLLLHTCFWTTMRSMNLRGKAVVMLK